MGCYRSSRMWFLRNRTDFAAERTWVRDVDGAHRWVVAIKGTFEVDASGRGELYEDQPDVRLAPEYRGEDGESSLRHIAELGHPRPGTDLLIEGAAHAPGGKARTSCPVGLRVGSLRKDMVVLGEREYRRNALGVVEPSDARPFLSMPVTYERAYGGFDKEVPMMHAPNPVGRGFRARPGDPAPNVLPPDLSLRTCGFGPVSSYWAPRLSLAGTYDGAWIADRKPLLPTDFNPAHWLCAPADQRPAPFLAAGTRIEVINMNERGHFAFVVPMIEFRVTSWFGRRDVSQTTSIASVVCEPGEERATVVWQSSLACHEDAADLEQCVIEVAAS